MSTKAKQLLADSGYKGEPVIVVGTPQLPIINVMSQLLAQRLRDAGMNVDLQMGDWTTVSSALTPDARERWNVTGLIFAGRHGVQPIDQLDTRYVMRSELHSRMGFRAIPRARACVAPC